MSNSLADFNLEPEQMLADLPLFLAEIRKLADEIGLDADSLVADHIALRINDAVLAEQAHKAWLDYGKQISSAQINGRPIVVIRLDKALAAFAGEIACLELPYPAVGKIYPEQGWEHIEFVLPSAKTEAESYLAELKQRFPLLADNWPGLMQQGIEIKLSSPKGEGERLANPTVAFKKAGICIKLHPYSLSDVIESENN